MNIVFKEKSGLVVSMLTHTTRMQADRKSLKIEVNLNVSPDKAEGFEEFESQSKSTGS